MLISRIKKSVRYYLLGRFNVVLFTTLIIAFCLRVYKLGGDLYFDEAATWSVAKLSSVLDIFRGNYVDVGNPPLVYLLYKPLLLIVHSEVQLRFISVIFGVLSLLYIFKLYSLSQNKWLSLLAFTLIALNPVHVHYSREFRYYSIGFFIQAFCLYYYHKGVLEGFRTRWVYLIIISLLVGVFITFSSLYLIVIFALAEIFILRYGNNSNRRKLFLAGFGISGALISIWLVYFFLNGGGIEALHNYVGYKNRDIPWSLAYTLKSLFFMRLDWGVLPAYYSIDRVLNPIVHGLEIVIPLGILAFSVYTLFSTFSLPVRRRYGLPVKNAEHLLSSLKIHALGFLVPLLVATVFTRFAFNIIAARLLLSMIISGILLTPLAINFIVQLLFPQKMREIVYLLFFATYIVASAWISFRNSNSARYSIRPYVDKILQGTNISSCSYIVVSHATAYALVQYYAYMSKTHLPSSSVIIPVAYSSAVGLQRAQSLFLTLQKNSDLCPVIYYLRYYDFWPKDDASYEAFISLISQYKLQSKQIVDPQYVSLEIYTK